MNTGMTIITFLMVFLIQNPKNTDSKAIHLKPNELIASHQGSIHWMLSIEDLSQAKLVQLQKFYLKLSRLALERYYHLHAFYRCCRRRSSG